MNKKIGFTIGKFAPFHKGHEYLIETALKETLLFFYLFFYLFCISYFPHDTH